MSGEHQLAFASFQRAIDLNPEDRYTYFKLGMMYEQLGTSTAVVTYISDIQPSNCFMTVLR